MYLFQRKMQKDGVLEQSGRSMIEMLGVLAIIGVLGFVAVLGYKMAMRKYQSNQIIDNANKYAAFLFIDKRSHEATKGQYEPYTIPTLKMAGFSVISASINVPEIEKIGSNSVILTIVFQEEEVCEATAASLSSTCIVVHDAETNTKTASITHSFPQS